MTPDIGNIDLASRAAKFRKLIERCEVTVKSGGVVELEAGVAAAMQMLGKAREKNCSIFVIGNGGSAGVASHTVTDLFNVAKLRAFTLHDSSLLTCMANDFGYENAFARMLAQVVRPGDVLVAISSSGCSQNILNAAAQVTASEGTVMTLSGFAHDNPLRSLGDINIWLDSNDYGLVEIGHQFVLHNMSDRFGAEYAGSRSQ